MDLGNTHYQFIYMFMYDIVNNVDIGTVFPLFVTYSLMVTITIVQIVAFHSAFNNDFKYFNGLCSMILFVFSDTVRFSVMFSYQLLGSSPLVEKSEDPINIANLVYDFFVLMVFFLRPSKEQIMPSEVAWNLTNHVCRENCDCLCSICLDQVETRVVRLDCGHEYHQECIKEWFMKSSSEYMSVSCPMCKQDNELTKMIV